MAILNKKNSRKFFDSGLVEVEIRPHGIGGIKGNDPVVSFRVGDHTLHMKVEELNKAIADFTKLQRDYLDNLG